MKWKQLANFLLDYILDSIGVNETIALLLNGGMTPTDLMLLGFAEEDIIAIFDRLAKDIVKEIE